MALLAFCLQFPLLGADKSEPSPNGWFVDEVWGKVGELSCLQCHHAEGEAEDSRFILRKTIHLRGADLATADKANLEAFSKVARMRKTGNSKLLEKPLGNMDHEGEQVLKSNSTGHRILQEFVRRLDGKPGTEPAEPPYEPKPFLEGVTMLDDLRLLRRLTLALAGRLPNAAESKAIEKKGLGGMDAILDQIMTEDAFHERLKEGFNDVFLTDGYDGNGELILSYNHFEKTRLWYQKYDLSHIEDKRERQEAGWDMARVYRKAIRAEPLELIAHVVRNNRPFTEIMTADYIMVSPYSARGYGIFEEVKDRFKDPENPFEYVPAKLPALKARNGKVQESKTGFYPHAGLLSMFQYLRRYPTTETNRNRLRARMYYQHFLGVDVLELADQVTDAAAVGAKYEIPWTQAPDCVICHRIIDPVAGLFQDFYNEEGHFGPRKDGWFKDTFGPGLEGEDLPTEEKWRSLQWLASRTAKDPRFAVAMTEHVWYLLAGRKALPPPKDIEDPMFTARRRAYRMQRLEIDDVAKRFVQANFNLKQIFKELARSPFYRADGLAAMVEHPHRQAELHDLGVVRLLAPEQLERKIEALFGKRWGRVESKMKILYGGINSKSVTERLPEPSGAMGAIQRIIANDLSCIHVTPDFALEPAKRRLFPQIEKDVVPGANPAADLKIRKTIVHLRKHLLDRHEAIDHPEVNRVFKLFASVVAEAKKRKGIDKREIYHCGRINGNRVDDQHYTLRGWRAVVTYLLRQQEFLYE
jgi:hypothetical protein|tara:strand:+ start:757 stop:3018 length:2262 start_codon:yes stop_codon:yes gene_type:complete